MLPSPQDAVKSLYGPLVSYTYNINENILEKRMPQPYPPNVFRTAIYLLLSMHS